MPVLTYNIVLETWEVLVKIGHRLRVDFHSFYRSWFLYKILGEHTHTRTNLEYGQIRTSVYRIGYSLGNTEVSKEMLTQIFLWLYCFHVSNFLQR